MASCCDTSNFGLSRLLRWDRRAISFSAEVLKKKKHRSLQGEALLKGIAAAGAVAGPVATYTAQAEETTTPAFWKVK